MAVQIDISRAPRNPRELRALVKAVCEATPEDEVEWIEWKSTLDLTSKEVRATLARHIIGMANRRVDEAARFVEGFGFILVGVEPGGVPGVRRVDLADLASGIDAYLGPRGPRWSANYDSDAQTSVLIISVDPPTSGTPIYTLHRDFEKYRAGDIFVRRHARTERASPGDVEYLSQRAAPRRPSLDLQVDVIPIRPVVPRLVGLNEMMEPWLDQQLARLLASLQDPLPPWPPTDAASINIPYERMNYVGEVANHAKGTAAAGMPLKVVASRHGMQLSPLELLAFGLVIRSSGSFRAYDSVVIDREHRTPEDYRSEVTDYMQECRWALVSHAYAAYLAEVQPAFVVEVRNTTNRNFKNAGLTIEFPFACVSYPPDAYEYLERIEPGSPPKDGFEFEWPAPPPPYGPFARTTYGGQQQYRKDSWPMSVSSGSDAELDTEWTIEGDLRPGASLRGECFLVVNDSSVSEIPAQWHATATNVDGRLDGEFRVGIDGDQRLPPGALEPLLSILPNYMYGPWSSWLVCPGLENSWWWE